ncbi:MAG: hypothetical protein ABIH86_03340 [Planctomycetota bacterium]
MMISPNLRLFRWVMLFATLGILLIHGCCNRSDNKNNNSTDYNPVAEELNQYLNWSRLQLPGSKGFVYDGDNPYQQSLVKRGRDVVDYINANQAKLITPANQYEIIWLLGEIADPNAFQLLLTLYRQSPDYRTAISLAACTSIEKIDTLINALNDKELVVLMDSILSEADKNATQGLTRIEIINYWKTNYDSIRRTVLQKTKPLLG